MKNKLINAIVNLNLDHDDYLLIKNDIFESNNQSLRIISLLGVIIFTFMIIFSFFSPIFEVYSYIYFIADIIFLFLLILSFLNFFNTNKRLLFGIYTLIMTLLLTSAIQGSFLSPNQNSVTFIAYLITVPFLFIEFPIRMLGAQIFASVFFIICALNSKEPGFLIVDVTDSVIFTIVSIVLSTYMSNIRAAKILFEKEAIAFSQKDILTDLYNRNMFEKDRFTFKQGCKENLSCIYIDANGLHEINNKYGHEAGDKMLIMVSDIMKKVFSPSCSYRVGGDEFIAICKDKSLTKIEEMVKTVKDLSTQNKINLSIGYAWSSKTDLDTYKLVKEAEKLMYDDKILYYKSQGRDIR